MADKKEKTSEKVSKIVDEVSDLSVLELSELVNALQEKFGVSAVAPMAAPTTGQAAPTEGGAETPAVPGGANQTLVMTSAGENKINVIKALREINSNLSLMDAKGMTENIPAEVLKDAKAEDVKGASEKLKAAGATIELK